MENPKTQKIIKKLIAEEWIACQFYQFALMAMDPETTMQLHDLFWKISEDERKDHMLNLIKEAKKAEYDVPKSVGEFERYAEEKLVRLYSNIKRDEDLEYYVNQAIKSEELAIASYQEAINVVDENEPELRMVILNAYYDEIEHLQELQFILTVQNVEVNW